jgi:hypothetical protein
MRRSTAARLDGPARERTKLSHVVGGNMKPSMKLRLVPTLFLALAGVAIWAVHASVVRAGAASTREPIARTGMQRLPEPGSRPNHDARSPELRDLDNRIKALRDDFHSQLDPLQAQIKSLRDKFDPQIHDLEDQRRALVEKGKPSTIQQLDQEEDHELADLSDREKAEVDKVKQSFAEQRRSIQQKYDERRKELRTPSR